MINKKTVPVISLLILTIFVFAPLNGCLESSTLETKIIKGIGDVGILLKVPYEFKIKQKITYYKASEFFGFATDGYVIDRQVSIQFTINDPAKANTRGTVNALNFNSEYGQYDGYAVANNVEISKQPITFFEFKTRYLTEITQYRAESGDDEDVMTIEVEDNRSMAVSSFVFTPPPVSTVSFTQGMPATTQSNLALSNFAIDPSLTSKYSFSELSNAFNIKYHKPLTLDILQNPDKYKIQFPLQDKSLDNKLLEPNSMAGSCNLYSKYNFNKVRNYWHSRFSTAVDTNLPPLVMTTVSVRVTINRPTGRELLSTTISLPVFFILKPMKEYYSKANYYLYDQNKNKYTETTTNPNDIFLQSAPLPPLKGEIYLFIPFFKFMNHFNIVQVTAYTKAVKFNDFYSDHKVHPPHITVAGYDFPILNSIMQLVCNAINAMKTIIDPESTAPEYKDETKYEVKDLQVYIDDREGGAFRVV